MAIAGQTSVQPGQQPGNNPPAKDPPEWKTLTIVGLTAIFVVLYVLALFGVIKPPVDDKMIGRLEPIIAVIIGYFFGRAPAEKTENSLKKQVDQQTQNAEAAHGAQVEAEKNLSRAETKVASAKAALSAAAPTAPPVGLATTLSGKVGGDAASEAALRHAAVAALKVLES